MAEGPQKEEPPPEKEFAEGSPEWWQREKAAAGVKAGRRVWAWELEPPKGHGCWYNKTLARDGTEKIFKDAAMDPPDTPDIDLMEHVPRPEMPNWWCPTSCGTLDLASPLTRHCFPPDASRHQFCCVDIKLPGEGGGIGALSMGSDPETWEHILDGADEAPMLPAMGGPNPSTSGRSLESMIRAASDPSSYSWCTCSEVVCEELLGGRVAWDQYAYTKSRYHNDQVDCGMDNVGYSWLTDGISATFELADRPLPEGDPAAPGATCDM